MPRDKAPVDPEKMLDDIEIRNHRARNLGVGMIEHLDQVMTRRGDNRSLARFCFVRHVVRVFDNLIDEVGACNESELQERDERIEKLCANITKLLAVNRGLTNELAAAREEPEKAQKVPEKCPEEAFSPNST